MKYDVRHTSVTATRFWWTTHPNFGASSTWKPRSTIHGHQMHTNQLFEFSVHWYETVQSFSYTHLCSSYLFHVIATT